MELSDPKYVEVYRVRNLPEAHSIRIALEEAGIRVQIEGELLQGAAGRLPLGWATAPRILVEESQVSAAQKIIERAEKQARADSDDDQQDEELRCLACGKKMRAREVRCPSCGWSYQEGEDSSEQAGAKGHSAKNGPTEASTSPLELPSKLPPPRLSQRDLRGEVLAVLAISVFPFLISVFTSVWHAPVNLPFWVDSVARGLRSVCIIFVVLYLIHRSGEPWSAFGIKRLHLGDILLGVMMYLVNWCVFWFANVYLFTHQETTSDSSLPQRATDYVLMVFRFSASALMEELVTRAYLITRLERLLRSGTNAVLVSAAVFASYHLYQGIERLIEMMILGLAFGFLYLFIRRIWPFAIGHALWNVVAAFRAVT